MLVLRDYQVTAVAEAREAFRRAKRGVLYQLATGGGKSAIFNDLAARITAKGRTACINVHRDELIQQTSRALAAQGIPHGIIAAGYPYNPHHPIQIASVWSLARRLDKWPHFDMLVFDECISGDSLIVTERGAVTISDLARQPSKYVLSHDGQSTKWSALERVLRKGWRKTIRLTFANGQMIRATPEHLLQTSRGWRSVSQLKKGELILSIAAAVAEQDSTAAGMEGPTVARSIFRDITRGLLIGTYRLLKVRGRLSSVPFSATLPSDIRTRPPLPRGFHRRMDWFRKIGLSIRRHFLNDSTSNFEQPRAKVTATIAFALGVPAYRVSSKLKSWFDPTAERESLSCGSIRSAISALLGGFAMTVRRTAITHSFIPKDIPKAKTISSPSGLRKLSVPPASLKTGGATSMSGLEATPVVGSSDESDNTYQSACATNWTRLTSIEPSDMEEEIFDLTIRDTHCYFANGLLVHNCHHLPSGTFASVYNAYPNAFKYGCSATPVRLDKAGLFEFFDVMIQGPSMKDLIARGYLAKCEVYAPPSQIDMSGVRRRMGDYVIEDLEREVDRATITGSAVDHYRRLVAPKPAIVFAISVKHAEHVAAQFREAGYLSESVDGTMSMELRRARLAGLANGSVQVLTSCALICEGVDIVGCQAVIMLRPTQSLTLYLQAAGRAMRPKPDGSACIILDHVGNSARHGLPTLEREYDLNGRKKETLGHQEILRRICTACGFIVEPEDEVCPKCGTPIQGRSGAITEAPGQLVKVTEENQPKLPMRSNPMDSALDTISLAWEQRERQRLLAIAARRGYDASLIDRLIAAKKKKLVADAARNNLKR